MENITKTTNAKITEALELLNEAAKEKKNELKDLMSEKYLSMKQAVMEGANHGKQIIEEGKKKALETVKVVDAQVRENPWPYIGGVALFSIVLGYFMGSKRR
ncbi:MAG: hypothetical protein HQL26_06625 [Candidatus Omnitrophica bacterium]|nr:hypothetical protein [Candidatus Omnitrophota bacterium]